MSSALVASSSVACVATPVFGQLCRPVVGRLGVGERCLCLREVLLRGWQGELAQLAHARLGLGHGAFGLDHGGAGLAIVKHDERVAGLDRLSFRDGDVGDDASDLAADIDAKRRLDMAARHDALHEVCAHDRIGIHRWPE